MDTPHTTNSVVRGKHPLCEWEGSMTGSMPSYCRIPAVRARIPALRGEWGANWRVQTDKRLHTNDRRGPQELGEKRTIDATWIQFVSGWPVLCLMAPACVDGPKHVLLVIYPYAVTTVLHGIRKEREKNWSGWEVTRAEPTPEITVP